jgi:hypothetical protein
MSTKTNTEAKLTSISGAKIEKGDELMLKHTDRVFVASGGGFGCNPKTTGSAIFGHWKMSGESDRVERYDVTGLIKAKDTEPFDPMQPIMDYANKKVRDGHKAIRDWAKLMKKEPYKGGEMAGDMLEVQAWIVVGHDLMVLSKDKQYTPKLILNYAENAPEALMGRHFQKGIDHPYIREQMKAWKSAKRRLYSYVKHGVWPTN